MQGDTTIKKGPIKNTQIDKISILERGIFYDLKYNRGALSMILPATLLFLIFNYFPMYGALIAFKDYDILAGFGASPWVGLKHFIAFAQDPYLVRIVVNTLLLGIYSLVWGFWPPIVLALLLNELGNVHFKKFVQSISYLPNFIATVVIVGMMMTILGPSGIFNNVLVNFFGVGPIAFFNEPQFFRTMFISSGIWQGIGWGSIIFLAALSGIDSELYEAAYIDGASRFQRAWHISVPGILPIISILLILNASSIINIGFEKVYLMYNPLTYETADVISTYVYRRGLGEGMNFSYATAIGLINSVVSLAILFITNRGVKAMKGSTLF